MKRIFARKKSGEGSDGDDEEDDYFDQNDQNAMSVDNSDVFAKGSAAQQRANNNTRAGRLAAGGGGSTTGGDLNRFIGRGGGTVGGNDEVSVDPSSYTPSGQLRPNYRTFLASGGASNAGVESLQEGDDDDGRNLSSDMNGLPGSGSKLNNIEKSAGTSRLNRILQSTGHSLDGDVLDDDDIMMEAGLPVHFGQNNAVTATSNNLLGNDKFGGTRIVKVADPTDLEEVGAVCSRYVIPPLKVDPSSIGGNMLDGYPESMLQETLLTAACSNFESTGADTGVPMSALQFPAEYTKHKRSLGLFGGSSNKGRATKRRFVLIARSTNKPLLGRPKDLPIGAANPFNPLTPAQTPNDDPDKRNARRNPTGDDYGDESERADYDAMFAPDEVDNPVDDEDVSQSKNMESESNLIGEVNKNTASVSQLKPSLSTDSGIEGLVEEKALPAGRVNFDVLEQQEEVSSFPVLICMTLNQDGTAPDIRKLLPLDQLTTVQDLHSTVVQLAFNNGDTIRLDFGGNVNDKDKAVERSALAKERFIWSLLQIHAILCMAVVERHSMESNTNTTVLATTPANKQDRMYLAPLNVRNLDRAELQYVATVNGFLRKSRLMCALLERQRNLVENQSNNQKNKTKAKKAIAAEEQNEGGDNEFAPADEDQQAKVSGEETKIDMESMEEMAYDLMMGNFATRVTLFHSEEERQDAEEILNSPEWTEMLIKNTDDQSAAVNVAQLLGSMLQNRMRDLEAETCRRLIAWEDEKNLSLRGKSGLHDESDDRDTVDALALASLFKTLEALDSELLAMENWLQDRAAAIKPLTDDCADIEEENRQLEQQWKSYDMLGAEMRRLLQGLEINEYTEKTLQNPASALVYTSDGAVNVEESDDGIEKIYEAGKALLDAIEYPKRSGGLHLKSVSERAKGLAAISSTFCTSLAQIIVTVMEQFKAMVVAGSDYGKVSKTDTYSMIAKKVRDTQRKFQSALLGYIKLIEILAALNPDMMPALRDAYAEMVAESILMKKRMKGYFQALPAKNVAHLNKAGKDLKDYIPFAENPVKEALVNAPDIRAVLSELLPVIAREAYFTSALFGSSKKEQDGREKKRNFENAKNAVDKASVHFRYYVNRTCGIVELDNSRSVDLSKVDPMLCFVATIYLNEAMDNYIDREKKGGDHSLSLAYVRATILDLRKKADKQWVAWVEKQIEWIKSNEGVPLSGKRAGVFASFARFPMYLDHLMQCCSEGREEDYVPDLGGIKVINYYLQKMAVNLLESLKDCANRDSTEKTYAANVMKMENTYFFTQSIKQRGDIMSKLFAKQVMKANAICKESTDAYLGWMIKREFTALHELFSRVSKARKEYDDKDVIKHVPKDQFVKVLQKEASREVLKEKIGAMFARMEKHLSEEGGLIVVAWKALVKVLYEWFGRWEKLCTSIYQHKIDPSAVDVVRIAKAAGTTSTKTLGTGTSGAATNNSTEFGFKSILALGNNNVGSMNSGSAGATNN